MTGRTIWNSRGEHFAAAACCAPAAPLALAGACRARADETTSVRRRRSRATRSRSRSARARISRSRRRRRGRREADNGVSDGSRERPVRDGTRLNQLIVVRVDRPSSLRTDARASGGRRRRVFGRLLAYGLRRDRLGRAGAALQVSLPRIGVRPRRRRARRVGARAVAARGTAAQVSRRRAHSRGAVRR